MNPRFWYVRLGDILSPAEFQNTRRKVEDFLSGFLKKYSPFLVWRKALLGDIEGTTTRSIDK